MRSKLTITLLCLIMTIELFGQSSRYDQLLEITKSQAGLILKSRPARIQNKLDSWTVKMYYKRRFKTELSDSVLNDWISAATLMDTTEWTTKDFKRTLVIVDKTQDIELRKVLEDWSITDKDELKKYRNQLRDWTYIEGPNRPVQVLSRPVITADQNYGLVMTDEYQGGLCCGGQINLYKYEDDKWKDLGAILSWKY